MKFSGIFFASTLVFFIIVVSARNMEDNFEETKLNEFEDGNNQGNYFSRDEDSVTNVIEATLKRVRRAICGNQCSCGWGNCVYQEGYRGSICCSANYAWHCC